MSVSAEFTMNLLVVLPTISVPLLVKLPAVVKMFPLVTWKDAGGAVGGKIRDRADAALLLGFWLRRR